MNDTCNKLVSQKHQHNCAMLHQNCSAGMRGQRRALCVFTAGERFDLLQDAMSVVCGQKMCVFRKVHIVYLSECAFVGSSQSLALSSLCVCVCVLLSVLFMQCAWSCVCMCLCNVSIQGWRQD